MGSTQDKALIERTFTFLMDKARDQDVIYFFFGAAPNKKFRRDLMSFFEKNFDAVGSLSPVAPFASFRPLHRSVFCTFPYFAVVGPSFLPARPTTDRYFACGIQTVNRG